MVDLSIVFCMFPRPGMLIPQPDIATGIQILDDLDDSIPEIL